LTLLPRGKFHILPITTLEEGIEILTGVKAGRAVMRREGSSRTPCSALVDRRLHEMATVLKGFES